jgi:hypothetical protein
MLAGPFDALVHRNAGMFTHRIMDFEKNSRRYLTHVPPTRDAHRGETRLRTYKYDYELHIPEA